MSKDDPLAQRQAELEAEIAGLQVRLDDLRRQQTILLIVSTAIVAMTIWQIRFAVLAVVAALLLLAWSARIIILSTRMVTRLARLAGLLEGAHLVLQSLQQQQLEKHS